MSGSSAAYNTAYREANRAVLAEKQKAYYRAHRDEIRATKKAYRIENQEAIRARDRAYAALHRDRRSALNKAWRKNNAAHAAIVRKRWQASHPEAVAVMSRRKHLRRAFGMTEADYDALVLAQGGVCAICHNAEVGNLQVDHDHATGLVRGLLCRHCNRALGHMRDDPIRLQAAIEYLKR